MLACMRLPLRRAYSKNLAFASGTHLITLQKSKDVVQIRMRHPNRTQLVSQLFGLRLASAPIVTEKSLSKLSQLASPVDPKRPVTPVNKHMRDSYCEVILPLRDSSDLLEDYINFHGGIRFGKLLEDLDALAASIAYLHCDNPSLTIVTASVDRIDIHKPFDVVCNLKMDGTVTYVGRSSMEITIKIESQNEVTNEWEAAAQAKLIMVARTPDGQKAALVNRLVAEGKKEEDLLKAGEAAQEARLDARERSLLKQPPTPEESLIIHKLFLDSQQAHRPSSLLMSKTILKSTHFCHPQERNIHNFIFGGFLMREAYELAFTNANIISRVRPILVTMDEFAFKHGVEIGAVLEFTSCIVYATGAPDNLFHVKVTIDVIDVNTGKRHTTNTSHFTFKCDKDNLPLIMPETYGEAMTYLEGKRRLDRDKSLQ